MKIALVHDWLTGMRGGEKVLEAVCELYPEADIYTLLWKKGTVSSTIENHRIVTSFIQKMPLAEERYRYYLPLMPRAVESFDLSGYDLIISTSHCVAKGVKPPKGALNICYCFTPMRYIWDQYEEYFNPERAGIITRSVMAALRKPLQMWDVSTVSRVHYFVGISNFIKERIKRIYGRESDLIYPPADVEGYPQNWGGGYFLMVTALVPYKRVDLAIEAFNQLGYPLKIIGSGPDEDRLKKMAGKNIEFLGWRSATELKTFYAGARSLIFPQEEDFGIVPVEAQAAGCPVIAFRKGGALETIEETASGLFFDRPDWSSLKEAVLRFEGLRFDSGKIKNRVQKFSKQRFLRELQEYIEWKRNLWKKNR